MYKTLLLIATISVGVSIVWSHPGPRDVYHTPGSGSGSRSRGVAMPRTTLEDRLNCSGGLPDGPQPAARGNTTAQVDDLIVLLENAFFTAYIVPSADAHQSEYVSSADERRSFISGFTGSAGTAVILSNGARALWTDGRYFLQADEELDCSWILMRDGEDGVPSITEWLLSELAVADTVAADARLITSSFWLFLESQMQSGSINVIQDTIDSEGQNTLDRVWVNYGRPEYSTDPIFVHDFQYAGQIWQEKVTEQEVEMASNGADVFIIPVLDEVAWLLNLRGSDIPYNPVFRSYVIIEDSQSLPSNVTLLVASGVPQSVLDHLAVGNCVASDPCVRMAEYNNIESEISAIVSQATMVMIPSSISYYLYSLVPSAKRMTVTSPVLLKKAQKNEIERAAMKNAHIKDGAALTQFMAFFEQEIDAGNFWTEISAQDSLASFRFQQEDNMGLSFGTISGFGPHGAIIHYSATTETDVQITDEGLYLLDSGGQYLDGTTDVTRTFHFGTPTDKEIEAYTRTLMGQIDFATVTFPAGTSKSYIDVLARRPLYEVGWDYNHGTSHGIGIFLNVHEGSDSHYELGFHGSDEPGVYLDNEFGVRLENVVAVVEVPTTYDFTEVSYGFETITLFPYQTNLMDLTIMSNRQCEYVNTYHGNVRSIIGDYLTQTLNDTDSYNWLLTNTEPIVCP